MSVADWRALLEALLDGRLSPQAFTRRFLQSLSEARQAGEHIPGPIKDMTAAVEGYDSESDTNDYQINSDELEHAARRALSEMRESSNTQPTGARTFDRARAREDMNRFTTIRVSGCAGAGCLIAILWVALCVLQITFVSEYVQHTLGMSAWPSAFVGFFLAFVPIIGNLLAFLDATQIRNWQPVLAAIVFFAAPAATMISGYMRWRRFR